VPAYSIVCMSFQPCCSTGRRARLLAQAAQPKFA
jgi:hypothetical protein